MPAVPAGRRGSPLPVFLHQFVGLFVSLLFVQSCCLSFPVAQGGFDGNTAQLLQPEPPSAASFISVSTGRIPLSSITLSSIINITCGAINDAFIISTSSNSTAATETQKLS